MLKTDAPEIKATMKSLVLVLDRVVKEDREITEQERGYFSHHLNDLQQFAGQATTKKLQQILAAMNRTQLQKALTLMRELL